MFEKITLEDRVEQLERRIQVLESLVLPEPEDRVLVKTKNLTLLGGFRIPNVFFDGNNTRYASGSFDYLNEKWIAHHGIGGRIIEYLEPGDMGTGNPMKWPLLNYGRTGQPFMSVDKVSATGVIWLDENRVLCNGRKSYRSGFVKEWVSIFDFSGTEQLLQVYDSALGDGTTQDTGNFHVMQAFGSGFCRIPSEFANVYTGGRTIGMGRGGYDVLGSPLGPALSAFSINDEKVEVVLLDHPQDYPAKRIPNYVYPDDVNDRAQLPMWKDVEGDVGYWQAGNNSIMTWIDHPTFKGVISCASQVNGTLDYRAQGDSGSGVLFGVANPTIFYSENSSGNRGGHREETQFQNMPPSEYMRTLYVYDPSELAEVAQGIRNPWECTAHFESWPTDGIPLKVSSKSPTGIRGLHWDNERQLLWVCYSNIWGNKNVLPILVAYRLEN